MLILLAACTDTDPSIVRRPGTTPDPTSGPELTDSGSEPGTVDSTSSTPSTPTGDGIGCVAEGPARGRCGVEAWAEGTRDAVLAGDGLTLDLAAAHPGTDTDGAMNGGSFVSGSWSSPELAPGIGFDALVPWWNATTPDGTWLRIDVQVRVGDRWSERYPLGIWASGDGDVDRHSFPGTGDDLGEVWTDTVFVDGIAEAARVHLTLYSTGAATPTVSRVGFAVADLSAGPGPGAAGVAWGIAHDVPARSQMVFPAGEVWCSPTSTSMIAAYWAGVTGDRGLDVTVPEAADGTYDLEFGGNGNWPFNVAYASSLGLSGEVGWFDSLDDVEPWIAAGVPVVLSAAWDAGDIDGSSIPSTDGHLLVLRGFDDDGNALMNDPAGADDSEVSLTYDRAQIEAAWLGGSGGITYLMWSGERPIE